MKVKKLFLDLKAIGIHIKLFDGQLKIIGDNEKLNPNILAEIRKYKSDIIEFLNRKPKQKEKFVYIKNTESKKYFPLTSAQKRLYILQQMELESTAYNMTASIKLDKDISKKRIEDVVRKLIARHESFRTSFKMVNNEPVQVIQDQVRFEIDYFKISKEVALNIIRDFARPFDLSIAPVLRVAYIQTEEDDRVMLFDMHHIISDGTSIEVLIRDFIALLGIQELSELRLQYKDYAEWQNGSRQKERIKQQESYWLRQFSEELPVLNLPTDFPRPMMQSFEGGRSDFELIGEDLYSLVEIAIKNGTTLYMMLLSAYTIMLSKLSGQEDIVVGTPIANRRHSDLEPIIGMFVNTLAFRNFPVGEKRFVEYFVEIKSRTLSGYENQEYAFEELVEKLNLRRDTSRNPLFDVMFNLLNQQEQREEISGVIENNEYDYQNVTSKFDLNLTASELKNGFYFNLEYCTKLFKRETIERFIEYFKRVIGLIIKGANRQISEIDIIREDEKNQILYRFNDNWEENLSQNTVFELFEEQEKKTPDSMAAVFEGGALTYCELNHRANQLGRQLRERGASTDGVVGLMLDRSLEMIIGVLGILKSGGSYLPIDTEYPLDRIEYMLRDSGVEIVISSPAYSDRSSGVDIIALNELGMDQFNGENLEKVSRPDSLLYLIYTSGTTGRPKGVMLEQRNLVNLIRYQYMQTNIDFSVVLQFASIGFDVSFQEIFSTLLSGNKLILVNKETRDEVVRLNEVIEKNKVKTLFFPTSYLKFLFSEEATITLSFKGVTHIIVAGEQLIIGERLKKYLRENRIYLHNHFGPTESHVVTTLTIDPEGEIAEIPAIGKSILNTGIYILDKSVSAVSVGVAGELYIGGNQVGRGYLGKPELTMERFIENPFRKGDRLYRTGDLARFKPDGNIEFLGRMDEQVKIRGFRVELSEIESILSKSEDIKEVVVIARKDTRGDKYLCAYVVSEKEIDRSEIRKRLLERLPDYMIPSYFVQMERIPLTVNGKVDRRALPEPEMEVGIHYVAPRNEIELKLTEIWSEILHVDRSKISMDSNFFELGGHSLKATILVSRIHKELEVKVPLGEVFKSPDIQTLSKHIAEANLEKFYSINPKEKREYYPVSSSQKRLFILQQMELAGTAYNMPLSIRLDNAVSREQIETVAHQLIARHESFRTSFVMVNNEPVQRIQDQVEFAVEYWELSKNKALKIIQGFARPFDLGKAPLLRVEYIQTEEDERVMMFDMHHIISDGTSIEILIQDFIGLMGTLVLPKLRLQYKDYANWQNQLVQKERMKQQEHYWISQFGDELPVLNLPWDYARPLVQSFAGDQVGFDIEPETWQSLQLLVKQSGVTLNMLLLAVYSILLFKLSGQEDIIVGVPIANRRHVDLESIIGMFVNTLVFRNFPIAEKRFTDYLEEIKNNMLTGYENQEYAFEELVDKLSLRRDPSRNPLFDVMFNLLNQQENRGSIENVLENNEYEYQIRTTKFDMTLTGMKSDQGLWFGLDY